MEFKQNEIKMKQIYYIVGWNKSVFYSKLIITRKYNLINVVLTRQHL